MPIQVDETKLTCNFCKRLGHTNPLLRSMHGLYCSNPNCYSRIADGNLAPPNTCEKCGENTFYVELDGTIETAVYMCIACDHQEPI